MWAEAGLRLRTLVWVALFTALSSLAVVVHGYYVNEHAEELLWGSVLRFELRHFIARQAADPAYRWDGSQGLRHYADDEAQPAPLRNLPEGLHDELQIDGQEYVVLVQQLDGRRHVLTLEITSIEDAEHRLIYLLIGSAAVLVLLFGLLVAWVLGRTVQPLSDLADRIGALKPEHGGERIDTGRQAMREIRVIARALNGYLARNEAFVERERAFINAASHELRTPMAVIAGSSGLALAQPGAAPPVRRHLQRIHDAARGVEQLIALLLVLAKDPARLAASGDRVALDDVLPDIVDAHRHLADGKALAVVLRPLPAPVRPVDAPLQIVQSAVGNLLRNAIENSDQGEIVVSIDPDATLTIVDPGHGLAPEEIARIYARMARSEGRGGGIGLALLARLSEHLGWTLDFGAAPGGGTVTTLRFHTPAADEKKPAP